MCSTGGGVPGGRARCAAFQALSSASMRKRSTAVDGGAVVGSLWPQARHRRRDKHRRDDKEHGQQANEAKKREAGFCAHSFWFPYTLQVSRLSMSREGWRHGRNDRTVTPWGQHRRSVSYVTEPEVTWRGVNGNIARIVLASPAHHTTSFCVVCTQQGTIDDTPKRTSDKRCDPEQPELSQSPSPDKDSRTRASGRIDGQVRDRNTNEVN